MLAVISGIYRIVNKTNGKFYVGSSSDIRRRWKAHLRDLRKNQHDNQYLQNAYNKHGASNFSLEVHRECEPTILLVEEQKELDVWVGNPVCYNLRKSATCPVACGEHRSEAVKLKISLAQKGKSRWTIEQRKQMSIDRMGRKHSPETMLKLKNRPKSCYTGIVKVQQMNIGRVYSEEHCANISSAKLLKRRRFNKQEIEKICAGVQKAVREGRYHKNKVPLSEYETIKSLYLSGSMNIRRLAFRYGITPPSMAKLLKRTGVK